MKLSSPFIFKLCTFLFLIFLSSNFNALLAKNWVVAVNGNDSNIGNLQYPYASLQKAMNQAQAGDTVFIRGGTYPVTCNLKTMNSGISGSWITYMAYPGESVWIDADNFTIDANGKPLRGNRMGVLQIEGVKYSRFLNINVKNSHTVGIIVNGPNTACIQLIGCKSDKSYGSGISVWYSDSVKVLHCEISGANDQEMRTREIRLRHEAPHEALSVCGATNFEIAWNHLHDCFKEGIDCKEVSAHGIIHDNYVHNLKRQGLYADCWFGLLEDVDIYNNTVHDCEIGAAISAEGENASMKNIRFHHNIIYNNRASGFVFGIWGSDGVRRDIYIFNNTIWKNGSANHWHGPAGGIDIRSSNLRDIYIYNNICAYNFAYEIATFDAEPLKSGILSKKNIVITHNLIAQYKNLPDTAGIYNKVFAFSGDESVTGDPLFLNAAMYDFRLNKNSPALNNGWKAALFPYSYLGAIPLIP